MFDTREIQMETFHDKAEFQSFIYQNNVIILDMKYVAEEEKEHFMIVFKPISAMGNHSIGTNKMPKIVKIESARHMDGETWVLGNETFPQSEFVVTEIKDMTAEFKGSIHSQYDIYANGRLYKSLVNMPVKVEYALRD